MPRYKIALLPGDGVGKDVVEAAMIVLEWLGEEEKARRMEEAIAQVIKEGKVRTYDLGGNSRTLDVAREVAAKL